MPRSNPADFICLRTYEITVGDDLFQCINHGKMGTARRIFYDDHLTQAQQVWLKTVRHWYIHIDSNWSFPMKVKLLIKKTEQQRASDNILLGLLLFS